MSETPDDTGRMPDAMPEHTEHFSSDSLPETPSNRPHTRAQNTCSTMANAKNQAGTTETVVDDTLSGKIASGGAGCALDMTNERDRGLVRQTIKRTPRRWAGVDETLKQAMAEGLAEAAGVARECMSAKVDPLQAAKVMASVAATVVTMEAQCQKDEHRAEDNERIDSGKATQAVQLYGREAPIEAV